MTTCSQDDEKDILSLRLHELLAYKMEAPSMTFNRRDIKPTCCSSFVSSKLERTASRYGKSIRSTKTEFPIGHRTGDYREKEHYCRRDFRQDPDVCLCMFLSTYLCTYICVFSSVQPGVSQYIIKEPHVDNHMVGTQLRGRIDS